MVDPLGSAYVRLQIPATAGGVRVEVEAEPDASISADLMVSSRQGEDGWMVVPFHLAEGRGSLLLPLEHNLSDLFVRVQARHYEPDPEIVLVDIDDASLARMARRVGSASAAKVLLRESMMLLSC